MAVGTYLQCTLLQALAWSFIFCFVVMTIWAMLMVEIIFPLIQDGKGFWTWVKHGLNMMKYDAASDFPKFCLTGILDTFYRSLSFF